MLDVGRKVVPDKGRPSRERPVTKALRVSILHRKEFSFHQQWNGEYQMECTHRGRMTGMVAGYQERDFNTYPFSNIYPISNTYPISNREISTALDQGFSTVKVVSSHSQVKGCVTHLIT